MIIYMICLCTGGVEPMGGSHVYVASLPHADPDADGARERGLSAGYTAACQATGDHGCFEGPR